MGLVNKSILSKPAAANTSTITVAQSVANAGTYSMPTSKAGFAWVMIGDNREWARFNFKADATVELIDSSPNVATSDTAGTLSIYGGGTSVTIKNNLGSTLTLRVMCVYG